MAQQSARRGWDNQGFPLCLEHASGDLDPVRELPPGRRLCSCRIEGRTDDSIRPRAAAIPPFSLAWKGRPQMESRHSFLLDGSMEVRRFLPALAPEREGSTQGSRLLRAELSAAHHPNRNCCC